MAKESMKAREVKRQKLVNKNADKITELKAAGNMKDCKNYQKIRHLFVYTTDAN